MKDILKDIIQPTMNIYQTAFKEGKKIGYEEGYRKAHQEFKDLLNKDNNVCETAPYPKCNGAEGCDTCSDNTNLN